MKSILIQWNCDSQSQNHLQIDQDHYMGHFNRLNVKEITFKMFRSIFQELAYIAYSMMPNILVFVARMYQYTKVMFLKDKLECIRPLNKFLKTMKDCHSQEGLKYAKLDPERAEVVVVDGTFAFNPDK